MPGRRRVLCGLAGGAAALALPGCRDGAEEWYGIDVAGTLPDLAFAMTRAEDGAAVTEEAYRGQVVALFFGYTYCPDICPLTLSNLAALADALGPAAEGLSILFVTVDPERDTRQVLARYAAAFGDRVTALRGDENRLASLARRYRVTYKVAEHEPGEDYYAVSHGTSVYVFDAQGDARLIWPDFHTAGADIEAAAGDLSRLIGA